MLTFEDMQKLLTARDNAAAVDVSSVDVTLAHPSFLYVGSAGSVQLDTVGGQTGITFAAVPAGTVIPVRATKVYHSGTSAGSIVALY